MATIKITDLPSLTSPDANTSNTVFVVVDKSSGTPTTKQVTLGVLDTAIDDVAAGAYNQANAAFDAANTSATTALNSYTHANGAFDAANTNTTTATNAYNHANGAFDAANTNTTAATNAYNHANGAFDAANASSTLAQNAYDYANTIVSDTQVDPYARAHANGAFDLANGTAGIANTDVTNVSISAGDYGSEVIIPVIHLEANGRVSSVTNTNIRAASTTETGVVLIEDSVISTSTSNAAAPNSVKISFDHANVAFDLANTNRDRLDDLDTSVLRVVANVPSTPIGLDGDSTKDTALANDYIYIAIADYDGSTNIWVRFAVTDSW